MKKNLYKYAALSIIGQTLNEKVEMLRYDAEYTKNRYKDEDEGIPKWAQDSIEKNTEMADFIDDFISKL